jgi:hypothetical protein
VTRRSKGASAKFIVTATDRPFNRVVPAVSRWPVRSARNFGIAFILVYFEWTDTFTCVTTII